MERCVEIRPESHRLSRDLFLKAIETEPNSAIGYIWFARAETGLAAYGWSADPDATRRNAMAAGLRAVQLDAKNPYAHYAVAISHAFAGEAETAVRAAQRAVTLSPSFALGHLVLGAAYLHAGRPEEAIEPLEHGLRLSPFDPQNFAWLFFLALAFGFSGQPERALEAARRSLSLRPEWLAALKVEVWCCAALGDHGRARLIASGIEPSCDARGDLSAFMSKLDPAWVEAIESSVRQATA